MRLRKNCAWRSLRHSMWQPGLSEGQCLPGWRPSPADGRLEERALPPASNASGRHGRGPHQTTLSDQIVGGAQPKDLAVLHLVDVHVGAVQFAVALKRVRVGHALELDRFN